MQVALEPDQLAASGISVNKKRLAIDRESMMCTGHWRCSWAVFGIVD
jgi:hypothetical protein